MWAAIVAVTCVVRRAARGRARLLHRARCRERLGRASRRTSCRRCSSASARSTGRCGAAWRSRSSSAPGRSRSSRSFALRRRARDATRARARGGSAPRASLLVVTRPEAATTIAGFGVARRARAPRLAPARASRARSLRVGAPGRRGARRARRSRTAPSPASASAERRDREARDQQPVPDAATRSSHDYIVNLKYAIFRNLEYHFTDVRPSATCIVPALALARASPCRETRESRRCSSSCADRLGWMARSSR